MIDYTGIPCPVCGKKFSKQDDIVVCPECGAPYHRECYHQEGHCIFEDRHGTSEAWQPPQKEPHSSEDHQEEQRIKLCTRCGARNYQDALFCDKCGQPFSPQGAQPGGFPFAGAPGQGPMPMGGVPFVVDPMGGVSPTEDFDGVSSSELASLVGPNTLYYLPIFKQIKDKKKERFSFSAFLFTGGWMLYRKQYKYGIIITVLMVALMLCSTAVSIFQWYPVGQEAYAANSSLNYFQLFDALNAHAAGLSFWEQVVFYFPLYSSFISLAIRLIIGFKGNLFYYRHCVSLVKKIKASASTTEECSQRLKTSGGVNAPLAICLLVSYVIITYIPMLVG